ncbi:ATP-binding protein [Streptomyces sp. CA-253872]|uniref:ATP-binding protein n=1 Tax=Streptomyces sp. CA-253872 TaxID=3240067 RepID=UPI003D903300
MCAGGGGADGSDGAGRPALPVGIPADLARAEDGLRAFLGSLPRAEAERSVVYVAVLEAVLNAVRHGHPPGRQAPSLALDVTEGAFVATASDHGPGFAPDALPDPLAPERRGLGHGRGLPLMRGLVDDVEITAPPGGGTRVVLRHPLTASAPAGAHTA